MIRKPYHRANLSFQPHPHWKVIALAWVAKALGVQFKINGIPYGGKYKPTEGLECVSGAEWRLGSGEGALASIQMVGNDTDPTPAA